MNYIEWYWWLYIILVVPTVFTIFKQTPFLVAIAWIISFVLFPLKFHFPDDVSTPWWWIIGFPFFIAAVYGLIVGWLMKRVEDREARADIDNCSVVAPPPIDASKPVNYSREEAYVQKPIHVQAGKSYASSEDHAAAIYNKQLIENLDVQEAAEQFEVSEATIRKWLNDGELEGYKDGRKWVIPVFSEGSMSVKEAAEQFGVPDSKVRKWLNSGQIAGFKDDANRWRVWDF